MVKNAWDLFSVTHRDVIGAAPFSVCTVPLTAFFLLPLALPFLILCLFLVVQGERPSFPLAGCSLRGRLGREELLAVQVGGCVGRCPVSLTCQVGSSKGSSLVVSASLPACGGWRPQWSLPG